MRTLSFRGTQQLVHIFQLKWLSSSHLPLQVTRHFDIYRKNFASRNLLHINNLAVVCIMLLFDPKVFQMVRLPGPERKFPTDKGRLVCLDFSHSFWTWVRCWPLKVLWSWTQQYWKVQNPGLRGYPEKTEDTHGYWFPGCMDDMHCSIYTAIYKTWDGHVLLFFKEERENGQKTVCFHPWSFSILFVSSLPKTDQTGEMEAILCYFSSSL